MVSLWLRRIHMYLALLSHAMDPHVWPDYDGDESQSELAHPVWRRTSFLRAGLLGTIFA